MKWLVRIAAGVVLGGLALALFQPGAYLRAVVFAMAIVVYIVARYEGIDVRNFWGRDDDDDQQGPFRPA